MIIHLADTISSIEFEEDKNENDDFIKRYENKLARELAVRVDGYQFTKPYKLGVWDGYTSTYDKTNHTFPTGLQDQVVYLTIWSFLCYSDINKTIRRIT